MKTPQRCLDAYKIQWWARALFIYTSNQIKKDYHDIKRKLNTKGARGFAIASLLLDGSTILLWSALLAAWLAGDLFKDTINTILIKGLPISVISTTLATYGYKAWMKIMVYYFNENIHYTFISAIRINDWKCVEDFLTESNMSIETIHALQSNALPEKLKNLTENDLFEIKTKLTAFITFKELTGETIKKEAIKKITNEHKILWPKIEPNQKQKRDSYTVI